MANAYHHGKRVSLSHAIILAAYEKKRGRPVYINQGRRTLPEQAAFYAHYLRYGSPLAARPWGGAPHIKWGAEHHALDINADVARDVADFYKSLGIPVAFNVQREPWHMDTLDEGKLKAAAARHDQVDPTLRQGQTGPSVVRLKKLLYTKGVRNFSGLKSSNRYDPYFSQYTKAAVKRFQANNDLTADGVVGASTWRKLRN
jgi:hypothetical protein